MYANRAKRLTWLVVAVAAAAMLSACGGGGDGTANNAPSIPTPTPSPGVADRIEPYDSGDIVAKSFSSVSRSVPAGRNITVVTLAQMADSSLPTRSTLFGQTEPQIGVARDVPALARVSGLSALLQWVDTSHGTRAAALSVMSEGAKGVRLGLLVRSLPTGAVLRFYAQSGGAVLEVPAQEVMDAIARNLRAGAAGDAAYTYWSPDFGGAETTVEIEIPASASPESVQLAVPLLSHYIVSPDEAQAQSFAKVGESGSCEVDVMCKPEFASQSRSVVRMLFVRDARTYLCTGTLLNDVSSSQTPYLLSANHCVSSQLEASSLITDWFYRASACNSATVGPSTQRLTGGATLLYAASATDTSFMRLNDAPPPGVVYAGSYYGAVEVGDTLAGVHHPKGDLQKFSSGIFLRFSACSNDACSSSDSSVGTFLTMGWQQGVTEGGSSGSALFRTLGDKRYVVGQLYGGASSCQTPTGLDHYGRFDLAYRSALKQWLNP